jgi:hypothetical protein
VDTEFIQRALELCFCQIENRSGLDDASALKEEEEGILKIIR